MQSIAQVRLSWNTELTQCHATAQDAEGEVLGEVTVEFLPAASRRIPAPGSLAQLRIADVTERHLRAMLALRG